MQKGGQKMQKGTNVGVKTARLKLGGQNRTIKKPGTKTAI
jgi:hypothetical protein